MPWGAKRGVDDLVARLARDDPTLTSLHVFRARTFGLEVHFTAGLLRRHPVDFPSPAHGAQAHPWAWFQPTHANAARVSLRPAASRSASESWAACALQAGGAEAVHGAPGEHHVEGAARTPARYRCVRRCTLAVLVRALVLMVQRYGAVRQELYTSGHVMEPQAAAAVSEMLCVNTTLHTLCVGDDQFGDQVHLAGHASPPPVIPEASLPFS